MHNKILIITLLLIFCFPFTARSDQKTPAKDLKAKSVEFYFNLAPANLASDDLQISLLKKSASGIIPKTTWNIPRATATVLTYENSSTIKLILDANPLRDFKSYTESEMIELATKIIASWVKSVECVTNAKVLQAQVELENCKKYQKNQTKNKIQQKILLEKYSNLNIKKVSLDLEKSTVVANMQAIEKKKLLITKALENTDDETFKKELNSLLINSKLYEIEIQTKLIVLTAMILEVDRIITATDTEFNALPESALMSEQSISKLAELANKTDILPMLIGGLGDAFKLSATK